MENYIINLDSVDSNKILNDWSWLIGPQKKMFLISSVGNFFFTDIFGHLYWVCTCDAFLEKITNNVDDFNIELQDEEDLKIWFMPELVKELELSDLKLSKNQIYANKIFQQEIYEYKASNFEVRDVHEYFQESSEILKKIKGW